MIGWAPRKHVMDDTWHLTHDLHDYPAVSLCGVRVQGIDRYVKRDPHRIDDYGGVCCPTCWREWRMLSAASHAKQDQHEAAAFPRQREDRDA